MTDMAAVKPNTAWEWGEGEGRGAALGEECVAMRQVRREDR